MQPQTQKKRAKPPFPTEKKEKRKKKPSKTQKE